MANTQKYKIKTLKSRAISAGAWSIAALVVTQGMRFGGNLVMTRLLAPESFGVMLIATTVQVVLGLLSDVGLRHKIIQSTRGNDPLFLNTAWSLQIIRGIALSFIAGLVAGVVWVLQSQSLVPSASAYAATELPMVVAVTGLSAIIYGFQSTKIVVAVRTFQQGKVVAAEIIAQLAGIVTMFGVGFLTHSLWSLVVAGLVSALVSTVLSHVLLDGISNHLRWDSSSLRELVAFGRWLLVSSAFGVLAVNCDRLLFGNWMSASELGAYSIALLILGATELGVQRIAASVVLPALCEAHREKAKKDFFKTYYRLRLVLDIPILFLCGFLFVTSKSVIGVLYDERYAFAGEMLEVLSLGIFFWRYVVVHQAWLAMDLAKYRAVDNIVRFVCVWTVVPVLLWIGGTAYAVWGIALHAAPTLLLIFVVNHRHSLVNFRLEISTLPILGIGALVGHATNLLIF